MSAPDPHRRPRPPATFHPRFSLSLLYLFGLFFVYCLLFIAPELSELVQPASPEQEEAVKRATAEVVRQAIRPRLPYAFAAAVLTLLLGSHYGFLPGLRPPGGRS